jgi:hypothetical protein
MMWENGWSCMNIWLNFILLYDAGLHLVMLDVCLYEKGVPLRTAMLTTLEMLEYPPPKNRPTISV